MKMIYHTLSALALLTIALIALPGCGDVSVEKPAAPDMSATVQAFKAPSAPLNAETLAQVLGSLQEQAGLVALLGVDALAVDLIGAGLDTDNGEAEQGLRVARQGLQVEGEGFLRVSRICDGLDAEPSPDPANGAMDFVVPFSQEGLDPVLWGSFTSCQYLASGQEVNLGAGSRAKIGDVRLFVGDSLQFGNFGQTDIIFELDVNYALDGFADPLKIEFQVLLAGGLEIVLRVDGGQHLIGAVDGGALSFRASNGDWSCDIQEKRCVESESNRSFDF